MQDYFFASTGKDSVRFSFRDILYIIAKNNYSDVVEVGGKKTCIHTTLGCLEDRLPPGVFMRVHRSYIISLEKVETLARDSVIIKNDEIPVSAHYIEILKIRLNWIPADCGCSKKKVKETPDMKQILGLIEQ